MKTKLTPECLKEFEETLHGLRYIAESPAREHGGFHPNAVETAKKALRFLEIPREYPISLQVQMMNDWETLRLKLRKLPKTGEGCLTQKHRYEGMMEYIIALSNLVDRSNLYDRPNAGKENQ